MFFLSSPRTLRTITNGLLCGMMVRVVIVLLCGFGTLNHGDRGGLRKREVPLVVVVQKEEKTPVTVIMVYGGCEKRSSFSLLQIA